MDINTPNPLATIFSVSVLLVPFISYMKHIFGICQNLQSINMALLVFPGFPSL